MLDPREDLTDLCVGNFKILQKKQGFRFSLDAILIANFAQVKQNWRVCDLGTGTGVIPLVLTNREATLAIDAVEIQKEMAEMARRSVAYNHLTNIQVIERDFNQLGHTYYDRYDLVISNPPYFPVGRGKISPLPTIALSRHEIACTLDQLIHSASRLLKSNGSFVLIHQPWRLPEILRLCQANHLAPSRLRLIHPTLGQPANLMMLEAIKGAKGELVIQPPLIVYEQSNQYSQEILTIYGNNERGETAHD